MDSEQIVRPSSPAGFCILAQRPLRRRDRKSTRLNSSHVSISYAVFCLKKKKTKFIMCFGKARLEVHAMPKVLNDFFLSNNWSSNGPIYVMWTDACSSLVCGA